MSQLYFSFSFDNKSICDMWHLSIEMKLQFNSTQVITYSRFEWLHFDIRGLLDVSYVQNHKYFLPMINGHTMFYWIILLKTKARVSLHDQNFIIMSVNQFNITPKIIRIDNGYEFMINQFYTSKGILHQK